MRELYDTSGPGKFEGEPPLTRYVYEQYAMNGDFGDEDTANSDLGEWCSRYGKRLLWGDSQGFIYLDKYATVAEAQVKFELYAMTDDED